MPCPIFQVMTNGYLHKKLIKATAAASADERPQTALSLGVLTPSETRHWAKVKKS